MSQKVMKEVMPRQLNQYNTKKFIFLVCAAVVSDISCSKVFRLHLIKGDYVVFLVDSH